MDRPTVEALASWHKLWNDETFHEVWVDMTRKDLQSFKDILWTANREHMTASERKVWDDVLRLPTLDAPSDWSLALRCLRAVCGYFEWRLQTIERNANRYTANAMAQEER